MKKYKFIIVAFFFALLFNMFIQRFDNKYTYNDIDAICGVVDYTASDQDLHFLTKQWEFYEDLLLTPETIQEYQPSQYIDIGEYGGFELGDKTKNPHGQATYRLRIFEQENKVVTLQLPEIYSAYHLYINGQLVYKSGEVEKERYEPKILSTAVTFTTQSCNEIIIQVSDYDHYYSGMIYPIAYGSNQQINICQSAQTLIKGLQSFLPLVMGVVCLFTYFFAGKQARDGYFSLVCFSYLCYVLYGIIHLLIVNRSFLWYRLEDVSYYFLIYFVLLLVLWQYQIKVSKRWAIAGINILAISLIVPTFFISHRYEMIILLGHIGTVYKYLFGAMMLYVILKHTSKPQNLSLKCLSALVIFFAVSLFMDNTFWYEPIYLGWGSEISGFALIAYFSILMVNEKLSLYKAYKSLTIQQDQLKDYIFDVAHDLKAPASSLLGYVELLNSGIAKKQNKEAYLLDQMAKKVQILSKRIAHLQILDVDKELSLHKEMVSIKALLASVQEKLEVLLMQKGMTLEIIGEDYELYVDQEKMMLCIENIITNAIEYGEINLPIRIELLQDAISYQIKITNQGKGIEQAALPHIFERHYTTGAEHHSGLGLSICKKIIEAHVGEMEAESKAGQTTFLIKLIKK